MKYPRPTYGIEAGSGGPAAAPITAADPAAGAADGAAAAAPAATDWRQALPDELRISPTLNDIADVNSLAQQFVDQQAFMGNSLRVPGPDAGQDDHTAFHKKLIEKVPGLMPTPDPTNPDTMATVYDAMGRPAAATDYTRPVGDDLPALDEHLDLAMAESMHRNGLNQHQYHAILGDYLTEVAAMNAEQTTKQEAALGELKQEWGYTYDQRAGAITQTLQQLGFPDDLITMAGEGKFGPQVMKAFYNVVTGLGGEAQVATQGGGADTTMTPAEAEAQIQEIMKKPEYLHHDMSVRKPWMDKIQNLITFAKPNTVTGADAVAQMRRSAGS